MQAGYGTGTCAFLSRCCGVPSLAPVQGQLRGRHTSVIFCPSLCRAKLASDVDRVAAALVVLKSAYPRANVSRWAAYYSRLVLGYCFIICDTVPSSVSAA